MSPDEEALVHRRTHEPSNLEVIAAFAPSDHLDLFCVGNKAQDHLYVMAQSWNHAKVIAMMGGHIRSLRNATRWQPMLSENEQAASAKALRDKIPGTLWMRGATVLSRDKIYHP